MTQSSPIRLVDPKSCAATERAAFSPIQSPHASARMDRRRADRPPCALYRINELAGLLILALCIGPSAHAQASARNRRTFGNPKVWHWAPSRAYEVVHYKLRLRFNEPKGEIFGTDTVTLRPFRPHFRKFYLDSSALTIDSVSLDATESSRIPLTFATHESRLWITLDRDYGPSATLNVRIVYRGFPRTGLFFVNPNKAYPDWPREVYSQGEPEFNQFWFPCWDYPNDMATSETITTVPAGQVVVSNGKLVRVTHSAGQTTYDWVESVPHSSYLISLAIGPWRKIRAQYEGKPVDYYVPRSVSRPAALRSFHLTPDMIGFFSRATGVEYPYEKYAQTTVHNFIFGGQENVSATTLTDWTLHGRRAEPEYSSTGLVAHELGQHWFGDYVQGRDWADIWLNEGFASYLTALYLQHHAGYDAYRYKMYRDQLAALSQDRNDYLRPIVDRHYTDPLQMFDAITHKKGAAVLDMLRYSIDGAKAAKRPASQKEPFFQALHRYLIAHHAHTAVTEDLIQAIRSTTGEELGWFFRQWVFKAGHPDYRVEASYDAASKIEKVVVSQTQHAAGVPRVFRMPIELALHGRLGEQKLARVRDRLRRQEFDIPLRFRPLWVDFDPDDFIEKQVQFDQPLSAVVAQALNDPAMMSRLYAVQTLGNMTGGSAERVNALARALNADPFYGVRTAAAASLGKIGTAQAQTVLLSAMRQPDSRVAVAAIEALARFSGSTRVFTALVNALHQNPSYAVEAAAALAIGPSGTPQAFAVLRAEAASRPEIHVMQATLMGLAATKRTEAPAILLAQAQPGIPERVRISALSALAQMKEAVEHGYEPKLVSTVRAALHDPFYLVQNAGEQLVAAYHLTEFRRQIEEQARGAPMMFQRDAARNVLRKLDRRAAGTHPPSSMAARARWRARAIQWRVESWP